MILGNLCSLVAHFSGGCMVGIKVGPMLLLFLVFLKINFRFFKAWRCIPFDVVGQPVLGDNAFVNIKLTN